MTDLFEKSIQILELPKVLERLAGQAVTQEGKERCLALRPMTDPDDVQRALDETSAAVDMSALRGSPSFSGVKPVAASLQRAHMGGALNTRELLDIAAVLRAARSAREYGEGDERKKTCIDHLFRSLTANRFLEDKITGSIVGEDEIADAASPELASIRRHIRATASKVRDILNKLLSSNQAKYLQEAIITQRNDRFVVPVKSEHKNDVPGLVHDVSSSGATFFIEPMGVVKANNELKELQAREEKEIERILAELSAECAQFKDDITQDYDLLILLDVIFARAKLAYRMRACAPRIVERGLYLRKARHPLLDPDRAVANDLMLGEDFDTLVITGPNTGGKTVTIKTIGLLTLMAQCGLHIPVSDDSRVKVFRRVLADVGDEQSIAQSLSTFSSHMVNIVGILGEADDETLILFDELGAGTDPIEGAALAAAIIESAREMGALVAATTHYAELKVYAMTTPGVENASCEFNVDSLAPTACSSASPASPMPLPSRSGWACPSLSSRRPPPASTRRTCASRTCSPSWTSSARRWSGRRRPPPGSGGRWRRRPRPPGSTRPRWRPSGPRRWRRPRRRPGPFSGTSGPMWSSAPAAMPAIPW